MSTYHPSYCGILNYHHCGGPKTWYGVPHHATHDFENVVRENAYDHELLQDELETMVYDFLIGKMTMFPPILLTRHGVLAFKVVQNLGDFFITFPQSYHVHFSHGKRCLHFLTYNLSR